MILIVCLDEANGLMFNNRRQSRDSVVIKDIAGTVGKQTLWLSTYSIPLFISSVENLGIADHPADAADDEQYCFCENFDPAPFEDRIEAVIIYRWNRLYPSDLVFTLDMSKFTLESESSFTGSSHQNITKEIWKK